MQGDSRLDTVGIIPICIDPGSGLSRMAERDSVMRRSLLITDGIPVSVITVGELLWSSVFVTLVAKKYRFMQFELDMVFDTR